MYIIFNEEGKEYLRYFLEDLPSELAKQPHKKIEEIPVKEGFTERATLVDDKIVWEYEKIEEERDLEKEVAELQKTIDILLGRE